MNDTLKTCKAAYDRFRAGVGNARAIQQGILRRIVDANRESSFGREHGFDGVTDLASFRRRVPLRDFNGFRPYIERTLAGEERVMSCGQLFKYISSSGSTGATKVIPLTREYFTEAFNPFYAAYLYGAASGVPGFLENAARTINFKWDPLHHRPKLSNGADHLGLSQLHLSSEFGDDGLLEPGTNAPWSNVPEAIASELDRMYYKLRIASEHDVRQLIGINPAIIAAVPDLLNESAERLADDLEHGTVLGRPFGRPNPELARRVGELKREHGVLLPRHLWPDIRSIVCWDEGLSELYIQHVAQLFGREVRIVPAPLGASECPLALHLVQDGIRGMLAYNSVFYEFLDVNAGSSQTPLAPEQLQQGGHYAVVVTQQSGFYRYVLGDVLEITGSVEGVPTIAYAGRYVPTAALQDCDLLRLMRASVRVEGLDLKNFSFSQLAPRELSLDVEFLRVKSEQDMQRIATRLRAQFSGTRLGNHTLAQVNQVAPGHFYADWKSRVNAGVRPAQVKDRILRGAQSSGVETNHAGLHR